MKLFKFILMLLVLILALVLVLFGVIVFSSKKISTSNEKYEEFTINIMESTSVDEIVPYESLESFEQNSVEPVMDTTAANIVDETAYNETDLTIEEINSTIYSYGIMFGLTEDEINYKRSDIIDNEYHIVFEDNSGKEYSIILDINRTLIKVIRP